MSARATGWLFVAAQAVLLVALVMLPRRDDFELPEPFRLAADALLWVGLGWIAVSAIALGRSLTPTPVPRADGDLRTSGPYRIVRHPIYSGVILVAIALSARSGSWLVVAVGVGTLVFFHVKASWEERRLRERYAAYADYAARTWRFFPGW